MTNNWTDMGNATCFIVMGANPCENHPASMAHINKARAGGNGHAKAKLVVIDPRKTRMALQADLYVRIRPGTDIAFINGLIRYIINNISGQAKTNWEAYLNQVQDRTYQADDGGTDKISRPRYTDARFLVAADGLDYDRSQQTGVGGKAISNLPIMAASYDAANTVYSKLAAHVEPYDEATVAGICGCQVGDIAAVAQHFIDNSRFSSHSAGAPGTIIFDPKNADYKSTTMLYAMGITQHTCGGQNVKSFAVIQTLLGNMGRAGGGINALRGIHNVQGSTDMGLLYHLIPGYSANPSFDSGGQGFGKYMDALYGYRLSGGAAAYDNAYDSSKGYLQQPGFFAMTRKFFGNLNETVVASPYSSVVDRGDMDKIFALWPKSNGNNHIKMFRNMIAGTTKGCVVWGQNPAVTEPNQSKVREGLRVLDTLLVVDMFQNETAACDRKPDGVTYLIPACSHVEEAGSVTNSGRVLQWRERATMPKGNSKSDIELLLRFARALDEAGTFSHISTAWGTLVNTTFSGSVYKNLYGDQYAGGWDPGTFAVPGDGSFETNAKTALTVDMWHAGASAPVVESVTGSEAVCERGYREMCKGVGGNLTAGDGGTMWLYTAGYSGTPGAAAGGQGGGWQVANRSKSRDYRDLGQTLADDAAAIAVGFPSLAAYNAVKDNNLLYKNWGYAWLVNRRVLYNQTVDTPWDQADGFQGPDQVARLFVSHRPGVIDYSRNYRTIHALADRPDVAGQHVLPGRFPSHVEPYETPSETLAAAWGRNTVDGARTGSLITGEATPSAAISFTPGPKWGCVPTGGIGGKSDVAATDAGTYNNVQFKDPAGFPFVLTTIRCVEHFQGGPITRNNTWNVEAEPVPWVEINSVDAAAKGIKDGDWVNITTARSNSTTDQAGRRASELTTAGWARGFKARVGVGLQSNQRVAPGVVAIPWHWGDQGLSAGSCANDLCIDAGDANTTIPESKACLCNITVIPAL